MKTLASFEPELYGFCLYVYFPRDGVQLLVGYPREEFFVAPQRLSLFSDEDLFWVEVTEEIREQCIRCVETDSATGLRELWDTFGEELWMLWWRTSTSRERRQANRPRSNSGLSGNC